MDGTAASATAINTTPNRYKHHRHIADPPPTNVIAGWSLRPPVSADQNQQYTSLDQAFPPSPLLFKWNRTLGYSFGPTDPGRVGELQLARPSSRPHSGHAPSVVCPPPLGQATAGPNRSNHPRHRMQRQYSPTGGGDWQFGQDKPARRSAWANRAINRE